MKTYEKPYITFEALCADEAIAADTILSLFAANQQQSLEGDGLPYLD